MSWAADEEKLKMLIDAHYPTARVHTLHAKNIRKNLKQSLGRSRVVVSYINNCLNWKDLQSADEQSYREQQASNSLYFLPSNDVEKFINLITKYRSVFECKQLSYHQQLSNSLVSLILNNDASAIEHQQIYKVLEHVENVGCSANSLIEAVLFADNSASKVVHLHSENIASSTRPKTINTHLVHNMYQQSIYAYFYFDQRQVCINIREWDCELFIPNSTKKVVNKRWFGNFSLGYLNMIAGQFMTLGYIPAFEIHKIQNVKILDANREFDDNNHPKHGIYKLMGELIHQQNAKLVRSCYSDDLVLRIDYV